MEAIKALLPLLGVVVGALLTGLSNALKTRTENKKTIASALSDLLEVRHHLAAIDATLVELKRRFEVPSELAVHLQALIEQFAPMDDGVHKRYDSAISLLAGIDPLLAFKMRSKNTLPQLISSLRGLAESNGVASDDISLANELLRTTLAPKLDEAVLELAGEHSWRTKQKVKRYLAESNELPPEDLAIMDKFTTGSAKARQ